MASADLGQPERAGIRATLAAVVALMALSALPAASRASLEIESLIVGASAIRFHDERLRSLYGEALGPMIALRARAPLGLAPALAVQAVWKSREGSEAGLDAAARTDMLFVPITLRLPFETTFGGRVAIGAGPQVGWAYVREDWESRLPEADIRASGRGTGGWLGAGLLGQVWLKIGGAGAIGIAADWMWAAAERSTARGNLERETSMKAGWSALRVEWRAPWPARP